MQHFCYKQWLNILANSGKSIEIIPALPALCPSDAEYPSRSQCPRVPPDASHLSTQDLLLDRPGLVYMVIKRQAISMRLSDLQLDACQILSAAKVTKQKRDGYFTILRKRGVVQRAAPGKRGAAWVPFRDGVFLCQAVCLENELRPLLSHARLAFPKQEENYLLAPKKPRRRQLGEERAQGYAGLLYNDQVIAYDRPIERTVNAAHLLKLGGIPQRKPAEFLKQAPEIPKQAHWGNSNVQATYISYEAAEVLAAHLDLRSDPVKRVIELASLPSDSALGGGIRDMEAAPHALSSLPGLDLGSGRMGRADSCFTEANYKNGSYLAPPSRSYLELLAARSPVEALRTAPDVLPGIDEGSEGSGAGVGRPSRPSS